MTKWEYKTLNYHKRTFFGGNINTDELSAQLNKLGGEGWELVSVTPSQSWGGQGIVLILKRST